MLFLPPDQPFPPVSCANEEGMLAISMDLTVTRLLEAYHKGIFPWYNEGDPVIWWSPDPRMVLFPSELRISKSMRKIFKDEVFHVTFDQDFTQVIENCRKINRTGQQGTWITEEIIEHYSRLHHMGYVRSTEVWNQKGELVGGLYGVWVKNVFCGESMFAKESNASKAGFISFVKKHRDKLDLIDCQIYTEHLASLGARLISRNEFLTFLK